MDSVQKLAMKLNINAFKVFMMAFERNEPEIAFVCVRIVYEDYLRTCNIPPEVDNFCKELLQELEGDE